MANDLAVNIKKTNYILFQSRSVFNNLGPVSLREFELQQVTSTKFIDVIKNEKFKCKDNVQSVCTKLSKHVELHIKLDATLLLRDYGVLICYHCVTYCVAVWGSSWPTFRNVFVSKQTNQSNLL